ncbi:MAG TPA: hypothetical protein VGO91_05020 [Pyrinomonadaceae bacterium]|jgi:hypothetical protein|nr:hypothetical protein [Pyrinomonadaceae bacterium]
MRKLLTAALIITAAFTFSHAQGTTASTQSTEDLIKMARAPLQPDGIGRAVVIVQDENGNPVRGAYAKLESTWGSDNFCESWATTGEKGAVALNPIHMGQLKLMVKAKGYQTQKIDVQASSLSEPVHVTLTKKK